MNSMMLIYRHDKKRHETQFKIVQILERWCKLQKISEILSLIVVYADDAHKMVIHIFVQNISIS